MDDLRSYPIDTTTLDYSMFSDADLANIILQRSEVLSDVPRPGDVIREWVRGEPQRLEDVVRTKGDIIAQRAAGAIGSEFDALCPVLDHLAPKKIADIGCGYGFFDLHAHARYGCDLLLIDIEANNKRHFGFESEGAAYNDLAGTKRFLTKNGVPGSSITTWNPDKGDLEDVVKPDLAVSFLACGFHFPVDMYMPFFRFGVAPGGAIILDIRKAVFAKAKRELSKLGKIKVIEPGKNRDRVLVRKGRQ